MARVQPTIIGLGNAQANITTASTTFQRFSKPNLTLANLRYITQNDAGWMGKGSEFATTQFRTSIDSSFTIEKFMSAEFADWLFPKVLGHSASGVYTPAVPATDGEEVPYFSYIEQNTAAGIDRMLVGCALKSFRHTLGVGPGLENSSVTVEVVHTGKQTEPSAVTVPAVVTETFLGAGGLAISVQGVDYVSSKNLVSLEWGWDNAFLSGYFAGSGTQDGFQIQGRMELGQRVPLFNFVARYASGSSELTKVKALTTGAVAMSLTAGSKSVSVAIADMGFATAELGQTDGKVTVSVTGTMLDNLTDPIMSVTVDNT